MGLETERKFLVKRDLWEKVAVGNRQWIRQGYLVNEPGKTIRVRLSNQKAYLTIKGESKGISRSEYEYEIPYREAENLLDLFSISEISKTRSIVSYAGHTWEVDEFSDENEGLLVAEIELDSEDETFELPPWIGKEVSYDDRYYNASLSLHPFRLWKSNSHVKDAIDL